MKYILNFKHGNLQAWQKHFFVLTSKQLIFTGEQEDIEDTEKTYDDAVSSSELHLKQKLVSPFVTMMSLGINHLCDVHFKIETVVTKINKFS